LVSALNGISTDGPTFNFLADVFEGQVGARKNPTGQPFAFANETKQQVLGFNRNAAKLTGFVPREEKNTTRSFRITFEHPDDL
jgi:hypothetical protein